MSSEYPRGGGRPSSLAPAGSPRLDRSRLRFLDAEETYLSLAFETSLLGFADTSTAIDLEEEAGAHRARGRVAEAPPGRLVLANNYGDLLQIRLRLPAALDLSPLVGSTMSVQLSQRPGAEAGRSTMDAVLRDARGALILWARDGALPGGRGAMGVNVRIGRDGGLAALSVAGSGESLLLRPGAAGQMTVGRAAITFAALRVGDAEAAFFAVRL